MEAADKAWPMTMTDVSGWMFLPVPAHPHCPGQNPEICKTVCVCACMRVCYVTFKNSIFLFTLNFVDWFLQFLKFHNLFGFSNNCIDGGDSCDHCVCMSVWLCTEEDKVNQKQEMVPVSSCVSSTPIVMIPTSWSRSTNDIQEMVCSSGISWAMCKSAPWPRIQTYSNASISPLSFFTGGCPSCHPTNGIKALKAQSLYAVISVISKHHYHSQIMLLDSSTVNPTETLFSTAVRLFRWLIVNSLIS